MKKDKEYRYGYRGEFSFRPIDVLRVVTATVLIVAGIAFWCS